MKKVCWFNALFFLRSCTVSFTNLCGSLELDFFCGSTSHHLVLMKLLRHLEKSIQNDATKLKSLCFTSSSCNFQNCIFLNFPWFSHFVHFLSALHTPFAANKGKAWNLLTALLLNHFIACYTKECQYNCCQGNVVTCLRLFRRKWGGKNKKVQMHQR